MGLRIRPARIARLACEQHWPLVFLVLTVGCTPRHSHEHADLSGKVFYKGQPLPGGTVTFVTTSGGYTASAIIDADGNYQIKAPIGEVKISVDNRSLQTQNQRGRQRMMRGPQGEAGANAAKQGHYVPLPSKYYSPDTSGLTYKVEAGAQTHDILLE